jgi:uncharacterized membrane protein
MSERRHTCGSCKARSAALEWLGCCIQKCASNFGIDRAAATNAAARSEHSPDKEVPPTMSSNEPFVIESTAARAPRAGREAWTGSTDGRSLASFLGLFSLALGAVELLAPRRVSRAIGLDPSAGATAVMRGMGVRELASGAGILAHPESKEWVGTRVAGDVMDLAALGFALVKSERPLRTLLASAVVLGIGALDVLATEQLAEARKSPTRDGTDGTASRVMRTITIGCSRSEAYALWRNFTRFPEFMEGIESVEDLGNGRSRWRARGPVGTSTEWESAIVADEPDTLIAWESVGASAVYHSGTVRFADAPLGMGTVVTVEMRYAPPGGKIASGVLKMFRKEPGQQVGDDLRRLKQVLELGEVLKSDASSGTTPRPAQPLPRETVH